MNYLVKAWSFSRLEQFERCPLQFKYRHIDKLYEPKAPAMKRGIAIHKEAENFCEGKLPDLPESCKQFEDQFYELKNLKPFVEQKWAFNRAWRPVGYYDKSVYVRVILDAGVLYGDGHAEAIDFKTGKMYEENAEQMKLFAGATAMKYKGQIDGVTTRLWYLDYGDEMIADYDMDDCAEFIEEFEDRAEVLLTTTTFLPRPNDKCRWCHWSASREGKCKYG